jgi:putative sigma-54 modulation protein
MEIKVTFRHGEHDEELKDYAEKAIDKVTKFLYRPIEAQVLFIKEKSRRITEVTILADHNKFFASEQGEDFYLTFDKVIDKVEAQVKKQHDRLKRSKNRKPADDSIGEASEVGVPEIIKSNEFFIRKPITVEEAVDCLENASSNFIVFRNAENEKICVLYRRPDGNYGLIDPN